MRPSQRLLSSLPPSLRKLLSGPVPAEAVIAQGWLKSVRTHKNVSFLELSDGTAEGSLQAVLRGPGRESLTPGTSVKIRGTLGASKGKEQAVELQVEELRVLGECNQETYPIQKTELTAAYLREHAHLRFRTSHTGAMMRIRDALARDWHEWFEDNEFIHVHTPLLTSSDCEGGGEVFEVKAQTGSPPLAFFPQSAHLTVSSQLHLEAPTLALSRAYTLSPAFRAEPSVTARHLSEFYMLEAEAAFVETLDELLDVVEDGIRCTLSELMLGEHGRAQRARQDLTILTQDLAHLHTVLDTSFQRLPYTEVIAILEEEHEASPFSRKPVWGESLASEHEKWLAGVHVGGPVFVTDYPRDLKPFYMLPSTSPPSQGPTVACFDLLVPGMGELAGGSLREHRLPELEEAVTRAGLDTSAYQWYLDLRRFGTVPHGGWGMGWERWVCWVTGTANVRDAVAFPRWVGNCRY